MSDFAQLGFDFSGFTSMDEMFDAPAIVEDKKAEKKSAAKKKNVPEKVTKRNAIEYNLPLTISLGFGDTITISGEGKITDNELAKKLVEEYHLEQFKMKCFSFYNTSSHVLVPGIDVILSSNDTAVDMESPLSIVRGETKMEIELSETFPNAEDGEVSVSDVLKLWIETYPQYKGCSGAYDIDAGLIYPYFDSKELPSSYPFTLDHNAISTAEYEEESSEGQNAVTTKNFAKAVYGIEDDKNIIFYVGKADNSEIYVADVCCHNSFQKSFVAKSGKKTGKKEQKITLPSRIAFSFREPEEITSEHFNGALKVTLEELKKFIMHKYKVFTSETAELFFCEEENVVIANLRSGKKG